MSFTHTDAPARTNAETISDPTPFPPPVTSAVRPVRSIVNSEPLEVNASGLHHHRDHDGTPAGPVGDEAAERLARVPAHGLEVGGTFAHRVLERSEHPLLRLFEEFLGLGRVDPAARHDLGPVQYGPRLRVDGDDHDDDALFR